MNKENFVKQMKRFGSFLVNLFGLKRNNSYVTKYLNDANIRSSIYMSFIVIGIEIWMIIRQFQKYIIPGFDEYVQEGNVLTTSYVMQAIFNNTSLYLLFIMVSLAVLVYAINYLYKGYCGKTRRVINYVVGGLCVLWIFLLIPQNVNYTKVIDATTIIALYATLPVLGIIIVLDTLHRWKKNKNNTILSVLVIVCFALVCLLFGIKVGFSDFISRATESNYHPEMWKMITCFLTMVLFVGCLLIWKPYISVLMLTTIFVVFDQMLEYSGSVRAVQDGDRVNYITFLISLTIIAISIYKQRYDDAIKAMVLEHDSIYDTLVDVHNMHYLTNTVIACQQTNQALIENRIYLFLNIVNFRTINDQKSFEEGNQFLMQLGKCVEDAFEGDYVSRQGDDHFVVFALEKTAQRGIDILENLVKDLSMGMFLQLKVGGYKPMAFEDPNRAIDKARYACGMIKNKFGINYCEYDEKMDQGFHKKQYIINHIDEAVEKEWIKAFYQPVVWSRNKELCGAEALARWIDPNYGFLSPGDFIPVLEETRLIHKLDKHIINYVCKNLRKAIDENRPVVPISINFSRLDFELMDAVQVLEDAISKYQISKDYIHVEITESALSEDSRLLETAFKKIKEDGLALWLDDFGSGYSSLNVLKDYSFDVVKIDMKFLQNFEMNEKSKDILDCIIQLANRLGMKTLTEGVESETQSKFLEEIGCDRLQGYLFGKPFRLEEFEQMIKEEKFIVSKEII